MVNKISELLNLDNINEAKESKKFIQKVQQNRQTSSKNIKSGLSGNDDILSVNDSPNKSADLSLKDKTQINKDTKNKYLTRTSQNKKTSVSNIKKALIGDDIVSVTEDIINEVEPVRYKINDPLQRADEFTGSEPKKRGIIPWIQDKFRNREISTARQEIANRIAKQRDDFARKNTHSQDLDWSNRFKQSAPYKPDNHQLSDPESGYAPGLMNKRLKPASTPRPVRALGNDPDFARDKGISVQSPRTTQPVSNAGDSDFARDKGISTKALEATKSAPAASVTSGNDPDFARDKGISTKALEATKSAPATPATPATPAGSSGSFLDNLTNTIKSGSEGVKNFATANPMVAGAVLGGLGMHIYRRYKAGRKKELEKEYSRRGGE